MNTPILIKSFSISSILATMLKIIYRNVYLLLGIFIIACIPNYFLRVIITQLLPENMQSISGIAEINITALLITIILFITEIYKILFITLSCAIISEKTILGESPIFNNTVRKGLSLLWTAFITMSPIILFLIVIYIFILLLRSLSPCISILLFVPFLAIGIYLLIIINSMALRGCFGMSAYTQSWNLMKGNWRNFIAGYFILCCVVILVSSPLLILAFLLLKQLPENIAVFNETPRDLLSICIFIGFTIIYLNVEYIKNITLQHSIHKNGTSPFIIK